MHELDSSLALKNLLQNVALKSVQRFFVY